MFTGVGDLQRDPDLHRGVRLDDGLRQLLVLLHPQRLHAAAVRADDVAPQLLRLLRLRHDEQRVRSRRAPTPRITPLHTRLPHTPSNPPSN